MKPQPTGGNLHAQRSIWVMIRAGSLSRFAVLFAGLLLAVLVHRDDGRNRVFADGGRRGPDSYHFDVWTTDNGLPQNSVTSIQQTRDGFLWFTTYDGLVRYDGVRFTIFNAANSKNLKTNRLSMLLEDRDGRLWILSEDGGLIGCKGGEFSNYGTADGLPAERVLRIRDSGDGSLRAETTEGPAKWDGQKFVRLDAPSSSRYRGFGFPVQSGAVWYTDASELHRVKDGQETRSVTLLPGLSDRDVKSVFENPRGELSVAITLGVLMQFKNGTSVTYTPRDGLPNDRINCILEDRRGNLWLGLRESGLVRFVDNRFTVYTASDGLASGEILTIYEDREGVIWVGTSAGLNRLRDNIVTTYSTGDGLSANNTYPIWQDPDGVVWIGCWTGLTKYKDGAFTRCEQQYGLVNERITALTTARDGALWIGTFGAGVSRFKDGKPTTTLRVQDGLPDDVVRAIHQDRDGAMWFGTNSGLARYKDRAFSVYTTNHGLPSNMVCAIYEDSAGALWIGTQLGLCRYADGSFTTYSGEDSLSGHMVRALYEDGDHVLWIGTYDAGLVRLKDGRFTAYTIREGLFNNGVFQILEDDGGNFWISCNLGIYRVSKQELTEYAEGRVRSITSIPYGKRDGMLSSECNGGGQPAGIRTADGRLWFPTQGGVAVVDPHVLQVSTQAPPLVIDDVLVNNQHAEFREPVKIVPAVENFEIHYTGLSFIMSERIRFKYKLEGLDTDWVDAGTRRVAYYSHVPPGSYTFRVIAANRDGVWNMEGATVSIRVFPPFWKTWWFLTLISAGLAGVVILAYRLRIDRLERARQAQEAFSQELIQSQEGERKRIAAELHDSLGQHLLIIKNSALMGLHALDEQDRGKDQLGDISTTASRAIEEVREISYNLRPYQLDDLGLTKAIESIVAKVACSAEVEFSASLDPIDGLFAPDAEINIYRIVQEGLNNIVKHSRASHAGIAIRRGEHSISMTIHDDGCGFSERNSPPDRRGGLGLKGISERARMLGARIVIQSAPGQGTTITLDLETQDARSR